MKIITLLLVVSLFSAGAQTPVSPERYTFKGYHLGMSLEEFRNATAKVDATAIQIDPQKPFKPKQLRVTLPVCTSDYENVVSVDDLEGAVPPGTIVCETAIHGENKESETVAGVQPVHIQYDFYNGKLYQIYFRFQAQYFPVVLSAFQGKYGAFSGRTEEAFQNGFGAKWSGATVHWNNSFNEGILLKEGSQNGPGQPSDPLGYNGSTVHIVDGVALQQILKTVPAKTTDF